MKKEFRSNGKLLLTAEYFVLDNAKAIALPTKLGQKLLFEKAKSGNKIHWKSIDFENNIWFEALFSLADFAVIQTSQPQISDRLQQIFNAIHHQNNSFFSDESSYFFETQLEFPQHWGLGSSSTLLANLSQLAQINPYQLLQQTFGGSGYDIACAFSNQPITFQKDKECIKIENINLSKDITQHFAFVFLNKKQDSRQGIELYKSVSKNQVFIEKITSISEKIISSKSIEAVENLLNEHESILCKHLGLPKVKNLYFNDYTGIVKSLGAWGGDFVLITKKENYRKYFKKKGFEVVLDYEEIIL